MTKAAPSRRPAPFPAASVKSSMNSDIRKADAFGKPLEFLAGHDRIEFQTQLRGRLLQTFSDPEFRPPVLPSVAIELIRLSRRADVGVEEIVKVLEKDQVLAADVLRLAQSAVFCSKLDVRSVHGAVSRIGLTRTADLFLRAALESNLFRLSRYGSKLEKLRQHSIATAEIGRLISHQVRGDASYAYLCGLLHDVGIAGAIIAITDNLGVTQAIDFDVLWPVLSGVHQQFTIQLASLWALPVELRTILRHHHTFAVEPRPEPLAAVTVLAEIFAAKLEFGFEGEESAGLFDRAVGMLGLSATKLEAVERDALDILTPNSSRG